MYPEIVVGRGWCTREYKSTENIKLLLIQPTDWKGEVKDGLSDIVVAANAVGGGADELE